MNKPFHVKNLITASPVFDAPKFTPVVDDDTAFDYSRIDDHHIRDKAQVAAHCIRENTRSVEKHFLDTGRILIGVKADLAKAGDQLWLDWLKEETGIEPRSAQNYMAVAERFGDDYHLVSYLPSQTLYALASGKALDEPRTKVIEAAKCGERIEKTAVATLISQCRQPAPAKKQSSDAEAAAAIKAVELIGDRLGSDLGEFLKLIRKAGPSFIKELKKAVPASKEATHA